MNEIVFLISTDGDKINIQPYDSFNGAYTAMKESYDEFKMINHKCVHNLSLNEAVIDYPDLNIKKIWKIVSYNELINMTRSVIGKQDSIKDNNVVYVVISDNKTSEMFVSKIDISKLEDFKKKLPNNLSYDNNHVFDNYLSAIETIYDKKNSCWNYAPMRNKV